MYAHTHIQYIMCLDLKYKCMCISKYIYYATPLPLRCRSIHTFEGLNDFSNATAVCLCLRETNSSHCRLMEQD